MLHGDEVEIFGGDPSRILAQSGIGGKYRKKDRAGSSARSAPKTVTEHPAKTYLELPTLDMSRRRATS